MILSPILEVAFGYSFSLLNSYKLNNISLLEHARGVDSWSCFWSISSQHLIKVKF